MRRTLQTAGILYDVGDLRAKHTLEVDQTCSLGANDDAEPRRHAKHSPTDEAEVLEEDERWQRRFHGLDNGGFEVRLGKRVHRLSEAERGDRVHGEAAKPEEEVGRLPSGVIALEDPTQPIDLNARSDPKPGDETMGRSGNLTLL